MCNPKPHTFLQKILQSLALLVASIGYTQPTTINPQLPTTNYQPTTLYIGNANNFYAAEGSIAVKGLTIIASENANTSVLTVFNSTPPKKKLSENQRFTSDLNAPTGLKTSLPKPRKHTHKTTTATAEVEKHIAQKTTVACPFGNYPTHSNSFYALHNLVGITSPTTPIQKRGEFHTLLLIKEFYTVLNNGISESNQSVVFDTTLQVNTSKYIGQITTRPPPFSTT